MSLEREIIENGLESFNRFYGVYRGFVHSNDDPENLGRMQLKVPAVYGDEPFEKWALPKGMYAGKGIGSFFIPNVGDTVWVVFEGGDPSYPIWDYGWYRAGDVPDTANKDVKVIQTTIGHKLEFDDAEELIRITDKHGHIIELNKNGISIVSDTISLGSLNESKQPAVVGNTAIELLNDFRDDIGKLGTITTSTGVTATINTSPQWAILVKKWDKKWEDFLSGVVTLNK